ncbi:MBL fold metallo-hydrolase [Streptomyces tibetensis]|uniref:MBL fold metallo-hydrolase n=1 Tax=Streptomyces tibetensis TaxID=2382123 RepID=A0ABW6N2H6_9ACTN
MQLTVLGGCGAWPTAVQACSGYLVEYAGFRLLIDPGYATLPRLLEHSTVDSIDAVLISHGHPDHCADLNPLLRARGLSDTPPPSLPVYAPHGAADAVLALDKPSMLAEAYRLREFQPGDRFDIGPFKTDTWLLPHFVPNAGIRLTTPDAGVGHEVPAVDAPYLLTARLAGQYASQAGAARLMLTHLWPGTDPKAAHETAAQIFRHPIDVATPGLVTNLARGSGHTAPSTEGRGSQKLPRPCPVPHAMR